MKAKITKFLKFFEIFGCYVESSVNLTFKNSFFITIWLTISLFLILFSFKIALSSKQFNDYHFVIQFGIAYFVQIGSFLVLLLTFNNREKEQKILQDLTETDELIEAVTGKNIKYNRDAFKKIFIHIAVTFGLTFFRLDNHDEIFMHSKDIPFGEIAVPLTLIFLLKYIFYVDVMFIQMKVSSLIKMCRL